MFALSDKTNIKKAFEEERKQSRWGRDGIIALQWAHPADTLRISLAWAESELRWSNAWEQA